jgi:hypothetical protein
MTLASIDERERPVDGNAEDAAARVARVAVEMLPREGHGTVHHHSPVRYCTLATLEGLCVYCPDGLVGAENKATALFVCNNPATCLHGEHPTVLARDRLYPATSGDGEVP